ncbi:putative protein kinase domain, leucine-rich repeat domain superfamily [Plasmopara halstedii]
MPNLHILLCTNTNITVLPDNCVRHCPQLHTISFNQSTINQVEEQALTDLAALHSLDLSHNKLENIPSTLFTVSTSWKALDFSHNYIQEVPFGIRNAVAEGFISFDYNALIEIETGAFADASEIHELRLASNAIFTLNSRAFVGMSALRKLNLSDNVISLIDIDAFVGVDGLEDLILDTNNIHRLTLSSIPSGLKRLELQNNLLDVMPNYPDDFKASQLIYLNLSHNFLWSISTNDALKPYIGLKTLDLSNNRIVNFSGAVFDPIMTSIEFINFDSNLITSIPSTNFIALVTKLRTNITLKNNPGIGWSSSTMRPHCPGGSVLNKLVLYVASQSTDSVYLYGCIQCVAGTFHDNSTGSCTLCTQVSPRAYSEIDGATDCLYCPYSSDLALGRTHCNDFQCNILCWLTISMSIAIPGVIFTSKFLLYFIMRSSKHSRQASIKEQEAMNDWRMGLLMHELADSCTPSDSLMKDEIDEEASDRGEVPLRIYDLPEETRELVLSTLRDYFQIRKEKRWQALSIEEHERTRDWHDVEWESFHMHRILSRSYHGEVFLGDYCGTQVVVKRLMTLRFNVKELADMIKDVELISSFHHPHIVTCLGTMWSNKEHFCIIYEYIKGGDLAAILEINGLDSLDRHDAVLSQHSASSDEEMESQKTIFRISKSALLIRFQMALDICMALVYMHTQGICHNDLRSRNILVNEVYRCKIGDARHFSRDETHHATHVTLTESVAVESDGDYSENSEDTRLFQPEPEVSHIDISPTLSLVAPEILQHNSRHLHVDIYSVGIVLLELWFQSYINIRKDSLNDDNKERNYPDKMQFNSHKTARNSTDKGCSDPRNMEHNAAMHHFICKLRMLANVSTDLEADENSFGTTMTSSLTLSRSSSSAVIDIMLKTIEDCLQSDPKRRPTASALVHLFQRFVDEINASK